MRVSDSYRFPSRGLTLTKVEYLTGEQVLDRIYQTLGRRDQDFWLITLFYRNSKHLEIRLLNASPVLTTNIENS